MASFSNTDTSGKPADPYKAKNIQDPALKEKVEDLNAFIEHCKFGMMTTRIASSGLLTSRCMALAAKEGGGVDLLFHTNTESGKTDDLQSDPKTNIAFLNGSGEWASISGEASIITDRETVSKYYSSGLKAWLGDLGDGKHDGGPNDPRIGVIKVVASTATYAIADGTFLRRGGEIAKGVLTGSAPKVHKLREISEQELEQSPNLPKLTDVSLDELTSGLEKHLYTSVDLVNAYTARVKEVNNNVNAIIELNPDALSLAVALDADRASGQVKGPLHGVPILIKDNMATMDKMNNTAGSYALLGAKVPEDSTVVAKLRAAGAIILGKTNLSEWAHWRGNGTNGWSAIGGQCEGVYYPHQSPSGSSSGSAVSTALGLAFAALGSETTGSLLMPAQASNLVAIKPTVGLTSRWLLVPVSPHQDTIGPISRSVKDAARILQTIAGQDSKDNYTSAQPSRLPDYVDACNLSALSGARIGVPRNLIEAETDYDPTQFNAALKTMQAAGATIVDNLKITDYGLTARESNISNLVLDDDFVSALPSYLSQLTYNPKNIKNVYDLRAFTQSSPLEHYYTYPNVNTRYWDVGLELGYNDTSPQFWANYQTHLRIGGPESILGLLQNHTLDALVAPTDSAYDLPARAGSPVITVPLGFNDDNILVPTEGGSTTLIGKQPAHNNPIGISFMGAKWSEEKLIGYAYAFEQKTLVRQKGPQPYLLPRTQLGDVMA